MNYGLPSFDHESALHRDATRLLMKRVGPLAAKSAARGENHMVHKWDCWRITALAVVVCSVMLFVAPTLLAQLPTGTILGVVKDPSGAVVPGAMVTATNADTGATRTVTTEADGSYRFSALPVGNYDISVSHAGFNTQTQKGLVLAVAQEAVINITLQVGSTTQAVEVSSEQAPLVETTEANLGGVVAQEKIQDLPLNGRNYLDLMLFQPGVTQIITLDCRSHH